MSSIINKATEIGTFGLVDDVTGVEAQQKAANKAAQLQADAGQASIEELRRSKEEAQGFLSPFQALGEQGLAQAGFLTDPQAQYDFVKNNPLFQASLANANEATQQSAAAQGRLTSGDTLQQLSNNVLLSASPLITDQKNSIQNLLNQGIQVGQGQANTAIGTGTNIANTTTDIGAALAAGKIGAQNAETQFNQGLIQLAGSAAGTAFSDKNLKDKIKKIGSINGYNLYQWTWNKLANDLGLYGIESGVIAQEVEKLKPEAITKSNGYMKVNYKMIKVPH